MTFTLAPTAMLAQIAPTGDADGSFWMPPQASTIAAPLDAVFFFIYWICVFFFVVILALMVYFCVKYRRRSVHQKAEKSPTHHTPLEVTWTVIPLILVILIFYVGLKGYVDLTTAPANSYEVQVNAMKWSWNFEHRNGAQDSKVLTVPAGRPVKLVMTSQDVLHAMFIPALRVKQDVVPGRYTTLWFEVPDTGNVEYHQIFCAEYCGTDHSQMNAVLKVMPPDQFEAQITADANILEDLPIEEYPRHFIERIYPRCQSCHRLDSVTLQGPGFEVTHGYWGKERPLKGGGTVLVNEDYIRESMVNPQAKLVADMPGVMTTFQGQLTDKQIRVIIEFLKRKHEVADAQGNILPAGG